MTDWIEMEHAESGGRTRIPAGSPDVLAVHEARGWSRVEVDDEPEISAPARADVEPGAEAGAWVELVHPDLPTATNRVPNHPDALQGAFDAGWTYPAPAPEAVREELREIRPQGGRPKAAERREAEQRAAAASAVTDEPPAPIPAPDSPTDEPGAGDDSRE